MHRIIRTLSALVAGFLISAITIPAAAAAPAQGGDDRVVIAAGNRGAEYNISSGSQLSAARAMLLDATLFGPAGTVQVPEVSITEDTRSITGGYLDGVHVLFDGWDRSRNWSSGELRAVDAWVRAGGVLITTNDDPDWDALGQHFGARTIARTSGAYTAADRGHPVVNGPFGSWSSIETAGWVSHLGTSTGMTVIASDRSGNAAIVETSVGEGHVIILADEGTIRGAASGSNRVFTGNLFAHAIALSDAPQVATGGTPDPTPTPEPEPTAEPTPEPTAEPTVEATVEPVADPTPLPTAEPTTEPTEEPTTEPEPTATPEPEPTATTEPEPTATPEPTTPPAPEPSLELVSDTMASIVAGDDAWVALTWRALADVEDLRVTLSNDDGVVVGYPENTVDHAGPALDTDIPVGGSDYTAFRLSVPERATNGVAMVANVTWTAFGERHSAAIDITLPTIEFTGQDIEVLTSETTVEEGWVVVQYRGLAPEVTGLQLRVTNVTDGVEYPRGDHTSLENDDALEDGETDLARIYVGDTPLPASGLALTTVYQRAGERVELDHTLLVIGGVVLEDEVGGAPETLPLGEGG